MLLFHLCLSESLMSSSEAFDFLGLSLGCGEGNIMRRDNRLPLIFMYNFSRIDGIPTLSKGQNQKLEKEIQKIWRLVLDFFGPFPPFAWRVVIAGV